MKKSLLRTEALLVEEISAAEQVDGRTSHRKITRTLSGTRYCYATNSVKIH